MSEHRDDDAPQTAASTNVAAQPAALDALRALTQHLDNRTSPLVLAMQVTREATHDAASLRYPEMPVLPYFRQVWAVLRLDGQIRRSLRYVPENAGPLNSRSLVHRALSLMQDTAPGYLQHLLAYMDQLADLGAVTVSTPLTLPTAHVPSAGPARKLPKRRTRPSSKLVKKGVETPPPSNDD
ncbi:DUF2894 domain-containing protein [Robbsia andropogonis]|uniref:DUF2894 domain-containing protein n=1 Tax=Robbsia andropogonis TaxID=28092 RepID=UPI000696D93F|nr:DUF2894 domain-containing protein [Robbsia andropogonis]